MLLKDSDIVLFQGDSITDCGRSREDSTSLGMGYPLWAASWFAATHPEASTRFINRGVSGNRVIDLNERYHQDFKDLQPTWVSILIGINDTWRRFDSNDPTTTEAFEEEYRQLLTHICKDLEAGLILMEPFHLDAGVDHFDWRSDLDPKIQSVRRLAREFKAIYIPLDGLFAAVSTQRLPAFWASDGVHPTEAGHALIAQAWLKAMGAI